jgi:aminoglycoside phosphotransferase
MMASSVAGLAQDQALPQRDLLLDVPSVAAHLARLMGNGTPAAIGDCERLRVNYQIGKSLRVLHRVAINGAHHVVAARAFREGRGRAAYCRAVEDGLPAPMLQAPLYDEPIDTVFWTFPHDRKLERLPDVSRAAPGVRSFVPRWSSSRLVAYAPEKSATLACLDDSGRILAYAKVSASDQAEHDFKRYRSLESALPAASPHLRLPRALGYSERHRTLFLEPIAGRRLADPDGAQPTRDLRRLGAAIATLHALDAPDATPVFNRFTRLHETAQLLGRVRPDLAERAIALADLLTATRSSALQDPVCLHGDVHPKNAIVSGDRVCLIDVEDLAAGPAAADIGSFLAGLAYFRCRDAAAGDPRTDILLRGYEFLRGYAAVRPLPDAAAIAWLTSASLFVERAFRAVTRIRPLGLDHLDRLLADAATLVGARHA